ncbi:hypothetical protein [Gordonia hankookensis]|uniref:WXG100 family type VII secretion target n=1 Tax=Gordonia hankookensis TaxID=589403 RepID=A0ABR7WE15_9ACTN|nr:hypothetical protein [Gordonia hankookensis]MBD1321023.1 hypothetical protein [Gordonia hankookensis]
MADSQMSVDVDEVSKVVAFYRRAADVVGSAADDIRRHELGRWALGEEYREMGARYREMGRVITERLTDQAHAADRLADALGRGIAMIDTADADNATGLTRTVGGHRSDGSGAA